MKKINRNTIIGLDEIQFEVETKTEVETGEIVSRITGKKLGVIKQCYGKRKGYYRVGICIPKIIREDNIRPVGLFDEIKLEQIINEIQDLLEDRFCVTLNKANVSTCEVNATAQLKEKENVAKIMNLLALMFVQGNGKVMFTAHGADDTLYKNIPLDTDILRKTMQIESLKTPCLGNKRFSFKFYDKSLEQRIEDRGILRLEQIYTAKGIKQAKIPTRLDMFLSVDNIKKLMQAYQEDFQEYFINIYWMCGEKRFTEKCVNVIAEELKTETPFATAKIHRDLLRIDFKFFEKACYKHYKNRRSAQQVIRRMKKSKKICTQTGAVIELIEIFRSIIDEKSFSSEAEQFDKT